MGGQTDQPTEPFIKKAKSDRQTDICISRDRQTIAFPELWIELKLLKNGLFLIKFASKLKTMGLISISLSQTLKKWLLFFKVTFQMLKNTTLFSIFQVEL